MRVEVYLFRKVGLNAVKQWVRSNGATRPAGSQLPSATNLMAAGNDIIIAVTCATFKPVLARITATRVEFVGETSFILREQIAVRPRFSLLLDCPEQLRPHATLAKAIPLFRSILYWRGTRSVVLDLIVFLAVLAAAVMHASWNVLVKLKLDRFLSLCA